uniref:Putative secreted protein n=1 Tax=Ixodes ricinus TaxID=34613 RepID=A0A6B0U440_IXORI
MRRGWSGSAPPCAGRLLPCAARSPTAASCVPPALSSALCTASFSACRLSISLLSSCGMAPRWLRSEHSGTVQGRRALRLSGEIEGDTHFARNFRH